MYRRHKSIAFMSGIAAIIFSFGSCGYDAEAELEEPVESSITTTEATEAQEKEPIEYIVVEPPEGGWTTEEIMNVTYFCDKKVSYPLSIEYLGDDFSLTDYSRWMAKHRLTPSSLNYKGKSLANAVVVKPHKETMIYNVVLFPDTCEVEDVEPFVINGIKMYDSFEDVLSALGDDYSYMSDDSLMYSDRETHESLYSLFFDNGKLTHINVDFRFEIDLPLYKEQDNNSLFY